MNDSDPRLAQLTWFVIGAALGLIDRGEDEVNYLTGWDERRCWPRPLWPGKERDIAAGCRVRGVLSGAPTQQDIADLQAGYALGYAAPAEAPDPESLARWDAEFEADLREQQCQAERLGIVQTVEEPDESQMMTEMEAAAYWASRRLSRMH